MYTAIVGNTFKGEVVSKVVGMAGSGSFTTKSGRVSPETFMLAKRDARINRIPGTH